MIWEGEEDDEGWEEATGEMLSAKTLAQEKGKIRVPEEEDWQAGRSIGIDLGTTNSAVGFIEDGRPVLVKSRFGRNTIPSAVAWVESPQGVNVLLGEAAMEQAASNPTNTFLSIKRLIGRTKSEARSAGVKLGQMGVHKDHETIRLKLPAMRTTIEPEAVSAELLKGLIADGERHVNDGNKIRRAVITVPAYFTQQQCDATERAGTMAGLVKVKLLREPEAAALAYGLGRDNDELVMVFDLGGGTFDVSILYVGGQIVEVLATSGDNHLGGDDFDERIAAWLADESAAATGFNPRVDPILTRTLVSAAQKARVELSNTRTTQISVPGLGLDVELTRKKMEQLCLPLLSRILQPMREAAIMAGASLLGDTGEMGDDLLLASISDKDVDYNPMDPEASISLDRLQEMQKKQRNARKSAKQQQKNKRRQREAFAQVRQNMEGGKLRAFPQGSRIDQVIMVGGATRMPCIQKLVEGVTGSVVRTTVNPDEAVALGAAVYAGIVDGVVTDLDVMSTWQAAVMRGIARSQLS
jgi:heat shock protein 1/8